jgi:hypothetical protein
MRRDSIFLSFYWSQINLAQSIRWMLIKGEKNYVISEDDADDRLEQTCISLDWCPTKGQQIQRWAWYLSHPVAFTRNFCSLSRWSKETFYDSRWQCQISLCQNGYSVFGSQFLTQSISSSLFAKSGPQTSGFSGIWKECFKGVHSNVRLFEILSMAIPHLSFQKYE